VRAASEGDGQDRTQCQGDSASRLHRVSSLSPFYQRPLWGTLARTMGDTRMADKRVVDLVQML
jgi:hypothetical protein